MDEWMPGTNDYANQSACGVPDSAYQASKVAIHPYWLKFAPEGLGLKRMCWRNKHAMCCFALASFFPHV